MVAFGATSCRFHILPWAYEVSIVPTHIVKRSCVGTFLVNTSVHAVAREFDRMALVRVSECFVLSDAVAAVRSKVRHTDRIPLVH